jgi:hypothetical protein
MHEEKRRYENLQSLERHCQPCLPQTPILAHVQICDCFALFVRELYFSMKPSHQKTVLHGNNKAIEVTAKSFAVAETLG